jgi:hypothetical protein
MVPIALYGNHDVAIVFKNFHHHNKTGIRRHFVEWLRTYWLVIQVRIAYFFIRPMLAKVL